MFRLPELTYPLKVDTIGKALALGNEISVSCGTYQCGHRARINLVQLAKRVGMDHGCGHDDLLPLFHCSKCRAAGRPDKNLRFTHHALTDPHSKLK